MIEIPCDECGETIARYKDGVIIICAQKSEVSHEIPLEWVFEAIRQGKGKGILLLRDYVDANQCIFG